MLNKQLPSPELLRKLLRYEPDTGFIFWRKRSLEVFGGNVRICNSWNTRHANKRAFSTVDDKGYLQGRILGVGLRAHRVAWVLHCGEWPNGEVDHENHIRTDNKFRNLRDATRSMNQRNRPQQSNNTSGQTGVSFSSTTRKWRSYIATKDIQSLNLGYFNCKSAAIIIRKAAESKHGYHINHGSM